MAIGDLNGEVNDSYLTPEQRAAKMAGKGVGPVGRVAGQVSLADAAPRQTSFDATNLPAKYAQSSRPSLASLAPGGAAVTPQPAAQAPAQPASLASLSPAGASAAAQPATQAPTKAASLSSLSPSGISAPTQPAASPAPSSLRDAYPTGVGDGRSQIYVGVGASGEPSFSNLPSPVNTLGQTYAAPDTPQAQRATSLNDAWKGAPAATSRPASQPAGQRLSLSSAYNPNAAPDPAATAAPQAQSLASLGSLKNLGDGVGTFSQSNPGDAALAMTRFQRAQDIRDAGRDKDRLSLANARLARDQNFTVVADSSRKPSLRDALAMQERQQNTENLQNNVQAAQAQLDAGRTGRVADQQQRQAQRLEDAFRLASSPNATPEQKAAYAAISDPTGEKAVARQLAQANIYRVQEEGRKAGAEADNLAGGLDTEYKQAKINTEKARARSQNAYAESLTEKGGKLPATLQKLEDADITTIGTAKTMNETLAALYQQIEKGELKLGPWENAWSTVKNNTGMSDQQSANYASFNATLEKLRNESLRLNVGPQTDGDAKRAWNELVTNISDPKVVQQRLKEIIALNDKAAGLRGAIINSRRASQGVGALDIDAALGGGSQVVAAPPDESAAATTDHSSLWGG